MTELTVITVIFLAGPVIAGVWLSFDEFQQWRISRAARRAS
jgi:hypothetical protein